MITQDELFKMLMAGADPEKLANDYATILNKAIDQKKAADEAAAKAEAEKAKRAEEEKQKAEEKVKATQLLLDHITAYVKTFYPAIYSELDKDQMTPAEFIKLMDSLKISFDPFKIFWTNSKNNIEPKFYKNRKLEERDIDEVINKFLKDFNL